MRHTHTRMQLTTDLERQAFDIHVTRRGDDRDAPPRIKHYRDVSLATVARFYELSGGKRTAYSHRGEERRDHQR